MDGNKENSFSRRAFVKNATALGAIAITTGLGLQGSSANDAVNEPWPEPENLSAGFSKKLEKPMIGIQTGVAIMKQKGVEAVLDDMQKRGGINALFLFSFTYIPKRAGIEIPGFHGGNFATVHPRYYKDIRMKPENLRSPDFGNTDFLAEIIPEA